ncbi:amino acid transporter [Kwoniella mangroviensis CBS 10435]|uniref:Amino acid transporter n=1 Tax=Kwoniella mangroviensis CBS 10435 TaxID=1331196 RepID=A0A1B9J388_9TREE|nr:amino acid transporter [Kwoniella mangroviensis CBS 8507]OCF62253.1 amino acid transporter [Kwoniella mangroviensis CBS 10435]OCF64364.1 amino acid transporter [Kwoniella mangroviensis CBS 8507]OCF73176.1 amino acid transporter [Kwoniella mangroviensis CBS 8886]
MSIERYNQPMPFEEAEKKDLPADTYSGPAGEEIRPREEETHRELKSRQISMIAIGGAIGTGLVIGSGTSLARSGPGSVFVAYCIMGIVCFGVLLALGEMSTKYPTKKGFAGHATRCVDPAFGFATAIIYLCKYLILSPNQIVAGSLVIGYWNQSVNKAAWVTILIVFVIAINTLGIKWFGEVEFWLSFIKIITLTGLILLGLIIDLGGVPGQDRLGFAYWKDGRAFKPYKVTGDTGKFLGWWNAMVLALFAYTGSELVAITVGEARNPRKTVPAAIKKTFFRIIFFYIFCILIVGMIVDSSSPLLAQAAKAGTSGGASASPFVVAIKAAGIKGLPSLINACILIFTMSAANSDQYVATRTLYGMAKDGHAPRIFTKCTKRGVPWVAFIFTGMFMGLAYLVASADALKIFNYFVNTVTILGGLTWVSILASHVAFMRGMKAQGISRDTLPYKAPFEPYLTYFSLFMICLVCLFKGFDAFMPFDYKTFITNYIGIPVYVIAYVGYKLFHRTKAVKMHEMDLTSGSREFFDIDDSETDEDLRYQSLTWKEKIVYQIKNW